MSPRLSLILTDWKTYTGAVIVVLAAINSIGPAFEKTCEFLGLPAQSRWILVFFLSFVGLVCLYNALTRRSILLRKERFVISPDDPRHFVGREIEVMELAATCTNAPLVFLIGESGSGKSTLLRAGLLPHLKKASTDDAAGPLWPILMDASSLQWENGIAQELAREVISLPPKVREDLGASQPLADNRVFSWVHGLASPARRKLLVVIDQMDHFCLAHQDQLVCRNKIIEPASLEEKNGDWKDLAELVRCGVIHAVFVCRNDQTTLLDAFRFVNPTTYLVMRIDSQVIAPLLDQITEKSGEGEVVADPEFGWDQLKTKFLGDIAQGGMILPIQLVICLDSFRSLRCLDWGEYVRAGRATGLERVFLERHLQETERICQVPAGTLLPALELMAPDDKKTITVSQDKFQEKINTDPLPASTTAAVIDTLEGKRIVRKAPGGQLLLYHDYLARSVRDAVKRKTQWLDEVRIKAKDFENARGYVEKWHSLLSLPTQARLLGGWLCGQVAYREFGVYSLWSMLRLVPVCIVAVLLLIFLYFWDQDRQKQFAREIIRNIEAGSGVNIPAEEGKNWRKLASARRTTRIEVMRLVSSEENTQRRLKGKEAYLAHALVGLDYTGERSGQVIRQCVIPTLEGDQETGQTDVHRIKDVQRIKLACRLILCLNVDHAHAIEIANRLVDRIKTEKDLGAVSLLTDAFGSLAEKLEAKDTQTFAVALVERMKTVKERETFLGLVQALECLSNKLEAKDARSLVGGLMDRVLMEKEDGHIIIEIGRLLGILSRKLTFEDVQPFVSTIVKRMNDEREGPVLHGLGFALGKLGGKLDVKEVQSGAAIVVERLLLSPDLPQGERIKNYLSDRSGDKMAG